MKAFTTLVPHLTDTVHGTDMSTGEMFVAILENLKTTVKVPDMEVSVLVVDGGQDERHRTRRHARAPHLHV